MLRFALIPATVALGFALAPTLAHEWYPTSCCSDKDCHPVSCDEITSSPDYYYWHTLRFPKNASFPSKDGGCHVCATGSQPRCLFFGGVS